MTLRRDLGSLTGSDKARVMGVVDDLERKGQPVRQGVPGDRRARSVAIAPAELEPGEPAQLDDLPAWFAHLAVTFIGDWEKRPRFE